MAKQTIDLKKLLESKLGDVIPTEADISTIERVSKAITENLMYNAETTEFKPITKPVTTSGARQLTVEEARLFNTEMDRFIDECLVSGVDFGVIPHCQKPTLLKSGAEKIGIFLGLIFRTEVVSRTEDFQAGFFAYEYGIGHFDLIIVDEAHRSLFNKYAEIFDYFDALMIGLTATPRNDIQKSTYRVFDLDNEMPNYEYDLVKAVKDGYLTYFRALDRTPDILKNGLTYEELSEEDQEQYEELFTEDDGTVPEKIEGKQFYSYITNIDTIRAVLRDLMEEGIRVNSGDVLGKTIIFARDHNHAMMIQDEFRKMYPELCNPSAENGADYCVVIDNKIRYNEVLQYEFKYKQTIRIVVSVDMMDTGVDIPEVCNLVFFKRVIISDFDDNIDKTKDADDEDVDFTVTTDDFKTLKEKVVFYIKNHPENVLVHQIYNLNKTTPEAILTFKTEVKKIAKSEEEYNELFETDGDVVAFVRKSTGISSTAIALFIEKQVSKGFNERQEAYFEIFAKLYNSKWTV